MLLNTMSPDEIIKEIFSDYELVYETAKKYVVLYDKERKKAKTEKSSNYCRAYEIKSKKKNNWILLISKDPNYENYKGLKSIGVCAIVYYYTSVGLRVFKIIPSGGLAVFNAHLFSRYRERMNLNMPLPLDVVKKFFSRNSIVTGQFYEKDQREYCIALCTDGLLLGEFQLEHKWAVYKTFISKNMERIDQIEKEHEMISHLEEFVYTALTQEERNNFSKVLKFLKPKK